MHPDRYFQQRQTLNISTNQPNRPNYAFSQHYQTNSPSIRESLSIRNTVNLRSDLSKKKLYPTLLPLNDEILNNLHLDKKSLFTIFLSQNVCVIELQNSYIFTSQGRKLQIEKNIKSPTTVSVQVQTSQNIPNTMHQISPFLPNNTHNSYQPRNTNPAYNPETVQRAQNANRLHNSQQPNLINSSRYYQTQNVVPRDNHFSRSESLIGSTSINELNQRRERTQVDHVAPSPQRQSRQSPVNFRSTTRPNMNYNRGNR